MDGQRVSAAVVNAAFVSLTDNSTKTGTLTMSDSLILDSLLKTGQAVDAATTGSNQTLTAPTKFLHTLTNASLVSISDVTAPASDCQFFVLTNATGNTITLKNTNSVSTDILTGTGADLDLANNASVFFAYDQNADRWRIIGGSGSGGGSSTPTLYGSTGTPRSVVAATGITTGASHMSAVATKQIIFVVGSISGESDISANPQITNGTIVGQEMRIVGTSETDYILLEDGNGLSLNGSWNSFNNRTLDLYWNGTVWSEFSRRD